MNDIDPCKRIFEQVDTGIDTRVQYMGIRVSITIIIGTRVHYATLPLSEAPSIRPYP